MKRIVKAGQPHEYTEWRNQMRGNENEDYRTMPGDIRNILLQVLNAEQGYLCGYTMQRINLDMSHVEHIKPESVCRAEVRGSDLDYANMIACYPKKSFKNKSDYTYGAIYKNSWWEQNGDHFISPLNPQCEIRINFNIKGEVIALNDNAAKTIEVLYLDHKSLTEDRRRTIQEFIYGPNGDDPLSNNKTIQAIQSIVERNHDGAFYVFCIAIKKALQEHIANLDKIAAKKKFAAQAKKK